MKTRFWMAILVAGVLSVPVVSFCRRTGEKDVRTVYTSTLTVSTVYVSVDDSVWVGTTGGILRRDGRTGAWAKYTRAHGLASHEVIGIGEVLGIITARFADRTSARFIGDRWRSAPRNSSPYVVTSTPDVRETCRTAKRGVTVSAQFGDAVLRRREGYSKETEEVIDLPGDAEREINTLFVTKSDTYLIGTNRDGLFERKREGATWRAVPETQSGPANHNAQSIAFFQGAMYVSTLQRGLLVRTDAGDWGQLSAGTLTSDVPRQLLVFQNALYVRHGNGAVDRFDGKEWARDVWREVLPRKQVSAFATDGERLFVAQWGGYSVWDENRWTHHLREPALQGVPITALLPDGETLYVGTQGRGLAEVAVATGTVRRWWNESAGVPDDWITALAKQGDNLYAGTFVGGLAFRTGDADHFSVAPDTIGENITDIAPLSGGGVLATTRHGTRVVGVPGVSLPALVTATEVEAQCVVVSPRQEVWIGARTGIYRVPMQVK